MVCGIRSAGYGVWDVGCAIWGIDCDGMKCRVYEYGGVSNL